MKESNSSFLRNLLKQPWWFWTAVAVMVFLNFRYFLPAIAGHVLQQHSTVQILSENAHWIAAPFFLPLFIRVLGKACKAKQG